MNHQEAKNILQLYRPNGADANDSDFAEALQLAEENEALKAWFESEVAFDQAFAGKLTAITPPAGFRERILAEAPRQDQELNSQKVVWWQSAAPWSAAACFLLLGIIGILLFKNPEQLRPDSQTAITSNVSKQAQPALQPALSSTISKQAKSSVPALAHYVATMTAHAKNISRLDYRGNELAALRAFLDEQQSPVPSTIPVKISALPGIGCVSLSYENQPVSMICFRGDKVYHLYVTANQGLPIADNSSDPVYHQSGSQSSATWIKNEQLYMLTVEGSKNDLAQLL